MFDPRYAAFYPPIGRPHPPKHSMYRTRVASSNLASVGYDALSRTLEVEFINGSVYRYSGVPENVYRGLMSAPSHGSYFETFVKKAGYSSTRVL